MIVYGQMQQTIEKTKLFEICDSMKSKAQKIHQT